MSCKPFENLTPTPRALKLSQPSTFPWFGVNIPILFEKRISSKKAQYVCDLTIPQHGFELIINGGDVEIKASDEHGIMYAHQLITQLKTHSPLFAPNIEIIDSPDFINRGVILDVSRDKIPKMSTLFELIDMWHLLRINQLQLYTEHTFAYKNHKTVWGKYSALTATEIVTIEEYCAQRGIELIANQATFGHMEKWLCHDAYKHLAEQTTGFIDQRGDKREGSFGLNPTSQDSVNFIESLFEELLPNFTSSKLNINFDETMDLGFGKSQPHCEIKGKGEVYLDYLIQIVDLAKQHGKTCQIFSDMLLQFPEIISKIPDEVQLLNWGYEIDHPFDDELKPLATSGRPFHVVVSTNTFASVSGRLTAAKIHMRRAAKSANKYGAIGYQISEWGDMGHPQTFSMPIPAYVFGSLMAWNQKAHEEINLSNLVQQFLPDEPLELIDNLLAIQDEYLHSGVVTPNCAFYGPFIFDQYSKRHIKRAKITDPLALKASITDLIRRKQAIKQSKETPLQQELLWTIDIMVLASYLALYYDKFGSRVTENFPPDIKLELQNRLTEIESRYERIWCLKHRKGGMEQSKSRLDLLRQQLTV